MKQIKIYVQQFSCNHETFFLIVRPLLPPFVNSLFYTWHNSESTPLSMYNYFDIKIKLFWILKKIIFRTVSS